MSSLTVYLITTFDILVSGLLPDNTVIGYYRTSNGQVDITLAQLHQAFSDYSEVIMISTLNI